jgi:acetoin utilization protein AcuB
MKQIPKIEKHMTPMPHTINPDMPIQVAAQMMRDHACRHLPVLEGGRLVGVLSDRDVKLAGAFAGPGELTVADVMASDPYTVRPGASLDEVVLEMAEHRYGCALIRQDNGKVVGIFTATDGLRVLGETLKGRFHAIVS